MLVMGLSIINGNVGYGRKEPSGQLISQHRLRNPQISENPPITFSDRQTNTGRNTFAATEDVFYQVPQLRLMGSYGRRWYTYLARRS